MPKAKQNIIELQKTNVQAPEKGVQMVMYKGTAYPVTEIDRKKLIITPDGTFLYYRIHMFRMKDDDHPTLASRLNLVWFDLEKLEKLNSFDGIYLHAIFDSDIGRLYEIARKLFATSKVANKDGSFPRLYQVERLDASVPDYEAGSGYMVISGKFKFTRDAMTVEQLAGNKVYQDAKAKMAALKASI